VSAFSTSDTLQVHNAGLVVLWPFLTTFFARLGLTEKGSFKDEPAAQRAVGLLQVLATADTAPPEPLLPLNKVLCGLAPESVFDFGPPCTAGEIGECDALLGAVIAQAPILGAMSIDGFRASFLLRQGQLGGRDGRWLLRVERLTHDIVLDRFPWGVQFVKLPWMQTVVQVEW
jgi:Contractile injection system tape measure protein